MCALTVKQPSPVGRPPYGCTRVRALFLRLLGLIFLAAFLSLLTQQAVLVGSRGLLPAAAYLEAVGHAGGQLGAPTLFWFGARDEALRAGAIAGVVLSFAFVLGVTPRASLIALWALYLSFVTVGQDFFAFQWDNLLLESAFFALFITPGGWRLRGAPPPHPWGVFLMRWLLFRLNFESGLAKLLGGDPTWRDLTALASYYETAPLPTWLGWYVHQMPLWAHRLSSLFTLGVEIGLALLVFAPRRRVRTVVFLVMTAMQLSILLTANYGFFNYLCLALGLFVLDDGHLDWITRRRRAAPLVSGPLPQAVPDTPAIAAPTPPAAPVSDASPVRDALLALATALLVAVSAVPFLPFLQPPASVTRVLAPVRRVLDATRSINAYHLFVHMTGVRREVVIEGSADGTMWLPYEFRYKPGDVDRAPAVVAPHQPRLDFQLWFLTLGGRIGAPYFDRLLRHLIEDPTAVAPLFARDPFAATPPAFLRVAVYRYRFTDAASRRATGAWWRRELLGYTRTLSAAALRAPSG